MFRSAEVVGALNRGILKKICGFNNSMSASKNMCLCFEGKIDVDENELNLDLTLLGGQSFRWEKANDESDISWRGVANSAFWILTQTPNSINFKVYPAVQKDGFNSDHFQKILRSYFRLDFKLMEHVEKWKTSHKHFAEIAPNMKAIRVLKQDPLENILSFICSQNNNIKRISTMVNWFCSKYGLEIGNFYGKNENAFPNLKALIDHQSELETELREAKFGYRAKFIAQTVAKIAEFGGEQWLTSLRKLPYAEARLELVKLPGIGFKVADCICLMSLNHMEAVPIDTHIYKIAQSSYLTTLSAKTVTPKVYDEIADYFRSVYGPFAGWAQAILFCSELQQFQNKEENIPSIKKRKKC